MTLRLVPDEPAKLDVYNFRDIADCARRWADQMEDGEQGEPTRIILVADLPGGLALSLWGENASGYEIMGILEAAKIQAHDANFDDD